MNRVLNTVKGGSSVPICYQVGISTTDGKTVIALFKTT
jgi:hypothetical protein